MFTPVESALGALLLQAASTSYIHLEGKVIGFSSIIYNSIFRPTIHSVSIVLGLAVSVKFVNTFLPDFAVSAVNSFGSGIDFQYSSPLRLLLAGLVVGFGSSAGCGCTSGHMLAGLSRLRWRSFIATCTFFASAVMTTFLTGNYDQISCGHNLPCYSYDHNFTLLKNNLNVLLALVIFGQIWAYKILPKVGSWLNSSKKGEGRNKNLLRFLSGVSSGFLFGCGLAISGMTDARKVTGFLSFFKPEKFDPSLIMIPLFCIVPNILLWRKWLPQNKEETVSSDDSKIKIKKPMFEDKYDLNFSDKIERTFLLGNILFGIGWGLAGVCPGPGILTAFTEVFSFTIGSGVLYITGFLVGSFFQKHTSP